MEDTPGTMAEFKEAFKTFDREGQGFINGAELRHVLKSLGNHVTLVIFLTSLYDAGLAQLPCSAMLRNKIVSVVYDIHLGRKNSVV